MELRHLRYFVAVAEEENVSRAARKLHVSQPALSRQIRDLEEELGFPLFERTAKSVQLTEGGRMFLREARLILKKTEEAVGRVRLLVEGSRDELHIGYAPSLTARFLPQALEAFQKEFPRVQVHLHDYSTQEMLAGLRSGKLDLAFLVHLNQSNLQDLRFLELTRDPICLGLPPHHPWAKKKSVALSEVATEKILTYSRKEYPEAHKSLLTMFRPLKKKPRIIGEHDSVSSLIAAVEAGIGLVLAPQSLACTAGARLKLIPFSPALPPLVVGAAWPESSLEKTAKHFLDCASKAAKRPGF